MVTGQIFPARPLRGLARGAVEWHQRHGRQFPWRTVPPDPWKVLLAEVLLRQTGADRVSTVYEQLLTVAPTPADLDHTAGVALEPILHPLGLQVQRAHALKTLARALVATWGGGIPRSYRNLLTLPHVGPYAAGAVTVFAYGGRAPMPDVNVSRLGARYFGEPTPSDRPGRLAVAKRVLKACPKGVERSFMYGILDLSAQVCRPWPLCDECPLAYRCCFAGVFRDTGTR